jgi:multiple sugar transport system ATP-binding protein
MNLIEGFLDLEGDLLFFSRRPRGQPAGGPDCRVRIAEPHATRLRRMAGAPITLGLRPEHVIQSSLAEIAHAQESVEAIVEMVEPLGAETYLHVRCAAGALVARADRSCNATRGRAIWMRLDTANAHFFEPGTGKAVRE